MTRTTIHFRASCFALVTLLSLNINAQFPVIGTCAETIDEVIYTMSSGKKLVHNGVVTRTVYNLDLSVFVEIIPPPLSPPWTVSNIKYISQDLFDTDPSTIEYVLFYYDQANFNPSGVKVLRTDGTVLFEVFPGTISMTLADEVGIYNTPEGAVMVIMNTTQPPPYTSTLYLLPGSLPCFDCATGNIAMASTDGDRMIGGAGLWIYPNPTAGAVSVRYSVPNGNGRGDLVIVDLEGAFVKQIPVSGSGTLSLSTADLAIGTYLCQLQNGQGKIEAKQLMVLR